MNNLFTVRRIFSSVFASLFIAAAYELRGLNPQFMDEIPTVLLASIFFVIGVPSGALLADQIFRFRAVRKWIMGAEFAEGYYDIHTSGEADGHLIKHPGLLQVGYDWTTGQVTVTTFRLNEMNELFETLSIFAAVRPSPNKGELIYINHFKWNPPGMKPTVGLSAGSMFNSDDRSKKVNTLRAEMAVFDETGLLTQTARRKPRSEILRLQKSDPNWKTAYLLQKASHA